jgi:hypothetical protein
MLRLLAGVVLGVVAWFVAVTALGYVLGHAWPALAVASKNPTTLTVPMLAARLGVSFLSSIASGFVAALVGSVGSRAALGAGVLLLAFFVYYHVTMIWHQFPVWYHLTFFVSLVLLSLLGGRLVRAR